MPESTYIRHTTLFVGNLSWATTTEELIELFKPHGRVHAAKIVVDRITGKSRGFGFIEMPESDALVAIEALNGVHMGGRELQVNIARPKPREPATF